MFRLAVLLYCFLLIPQNVVGHPRFQPFSTNSIESPSTGNLCFNHLRTASIVEGMPLPKL